MKKRCLEPNHNEYPRYGGAGITICPEWLGKNGYANFLSHMGRKPFPEYTVDRYPIKEGNYEPGNCRWADSTMQARNRKSNKMLTAFGKTQCLAEWVEETGISLSTIKYRLREGWDTERALTKKTRKPKRP